MVRLPRLNSRFERLVHLLEPPVRPSQEAAKQWDEEAAESFALDEAGVVAIDGLELQRVLSVKDTW